MIFDCISWNLVYQRIDNFFQISTHINFGVKTVKNQLSTLFLSIKSALNVQIYDNP